LPISGNPQITHFAKDTTVLNYKRHTNFQYGIVDLTSVEGVYETTLDLIKYIIIITDNLDDIMCINFIFPTTNEVISLSMNRLKLFDTLIKKTIFEIDDKYVIKITLANIFNFISHTDTICTDFINLFNKKLKIIVVQSSSNKTKKVKMCGCILDYEERHTLTQKINTQQYSKIINLPIEHTCDTEYTTSKYNLKNYLFAKTQTIVIKIPSFNLIKNIVIHLNGQFIHLSPQILKMYNDIYDQIVYDFDNYCIIKVPYLISTTSQLSSFDVEINFNEKCNKNFLYMLCDTELTLQSIKPLVVFTNNFYSCIQHYKFDLSTNNTNFNLDVNQMHIKEIIVSYTKNNVFCKPANEFKLNFNECSSYISKLDCEVYQELHHTKFNKDVYTIGFSLDPDYYYPNGSVNIDKIQFFHDVIDVNVIMDIYLVGYKVYKADI
jgi:hypothetical protein